MQCAPRGWCRSHHRRRNRQPKRRGVCVLTRAEDADTQASPATAADANQVAQLDDLINKLLACTSQEQVRAHHLASLSEPSAQRPVSQLTPAGCKRDALVHARTLWSAVTRNPLERGPAAAALIDFSRAANQPVIVMPPAEAQSSS